MIERLLDFGSWTLDWRRLALVVVATLGLTGCGGGDGAGRAPTALPTPAGVVGNLAPKSALGKKINETVVPEASAQGNRLGPEGAKVVIEAYEDFGCPHCLDFTANIEPTILSEYVAAGKVAFIYRYFPLRQLTAGAAIAAQCASEQEQFWPYHRALFIAQAEANEKVGPALTEAFALAGLKALATDLGLDATAFEACLASDAALEAVQADLKRANDLALPGTPSFVINGKVAPAPESVAGWRKLIDDLLK